jgi:hypothetical protein
MTNFDYRIIKSKGLYTIKEVYYSSKGKPMWWSVEPDSPQGETLKELKEDFECYKEALNKPVLVERKGRLI